MSETDGPLDLVVLGGGPGGYVAAVRAVQLGMRVAVVERENVGGVCLNEGCIPTKALLRSAEVFALAKGGLEYGVLAGSVAFDMARAQSRKDGVVRRLRTAVEVLLRDKGISVRRGSGVILSPRRVRVTAADGSAEELDANRLIVATGAKAKSLPGIPIDEEQVLSSTGALRLAQVPASLVVIGAGAVGVEFASLMATLGSKVTLLEALPHIVPLEDPEIAEALSKSLKRQKIRVEAGVRVESVERGEAGVSVQITTAAGARETVLAERLLMAVGRGPLTDGIGLDEIGVKRQRGYVMVDEHLYTGIDGVYAIGDCVPTLQLAHVASAEGVLAAEQMAGQNPRPLTYANMPRCTYSRPEVGSVGLTEEQAQKQGIDLKVGRFALMGNSRAVILGEREGFAKVLSDGDDRLIGVHMVGANASELIAEAATAIQAGVSAHEYARAVRAHPSLSEALKEAAEAMLGEAIHG
jgi:dihydrolipoamide dehydrogenase